jgi:hypothetical protein
VKTGKTAALDAKEWWKMIDAIPTETLRDLRDRALIANLTRGYARNRCGSLVHFRERVLAGEKR